MIFKKRASVYEVRFYTGHLCGTVEWDESWEVWRFHPEGIYTIEHLKSIVKFMETLK